MERRGVERDLGLLAGLEDDAEAREVLRDSLRAPARRVQTKRSPSDADAQLLRGPPPSPSTRTTGSAS